MGDGGAEDTKIVFDGNALDYYIGLDDSADNLIIGSGSTVGSNSIITIDSDGDTTFDIVGGITLDADDEGTISFKDGGSRYGLVKKASDNFEIQSMLSDGDIVFKGNDGGSAITALTLDMSTAGKATFNNDIALGDSQKVVFGASEDLQIYHDGSNSYVDDTGTGRLILRGNDRVMLQKYTGEDMVTCIADGAVNIYHNNSKKFETTAAGITVTGTASVVDDISIIGATPSITFTDTDNNADAMVYNASGNLYLEADKNDEQSDSLMRFAIDDVSVAQWKTSELVFNEESNNTDFRVEGNGDANLLFVDAGNDKIGIGHNNPSQLFSVKKDQNTDTAIRIANGTGGTAARASLFMDVDSGGAQLMAIDDGFSTSGAYIADNVTFVSDTAMANGMTIGTRANDNNAHLRFYTKDAERMRISGAGNVGIGNNDPDYKLKVDTTASAYIAQFRNLHGSAPYGFFVQYTSASPDGSDNNPYVYQDSTTTRFKVNSDGDVLNHDNSYGALSDERIKQDIRDSNSQWNDIKAIKVRNFKKKDDVRQYGDNAWEQIGVVAQELEAVSPKLIRHNNPDPSDILSDSSFGTLWTADDPETQDAVDEVLYTAEDQEVIDGAKNVGDVKIQSKSSTKQIGDVKEIKDQVKQVNYSILYMKAIKALQEAQTRIETLETKVAALEG